MFKVILFDLDDTLISEYEYIKSGYMEVATYLATKYSLDKKVLYDTMLQFYHKGIKNVFNEVLQANNISFNENDIRTLIKIYREHIPNIKYYDDVKGILEFCKANNIKTGIITDGYLETQRNKLQVLNAYSDFDKIILTEELGREYWKPHPKAFEMMKEYFGAEYNEMIYIGDNPKKDFYIKTKYPIYTIRIIRNNGVYREQDYYQNIEPNLSVKNLDKIYILINSVGEKRESIDFG